MEGRTGVQTARAAVWTVLLYALLTLAAWLLAPWVIGPTVLPLTRPLSAVLLAALCAVTLVSRGPVERTDLRVAVACSGALGIWSAAMDLSGEAVRSTLAGGPWAPYLGDATVWVSGWTGLPVALICLALLTSPRHPALAGRCIFAAVLIAYAYVLGWVAGADSSMLLSSGATAFPLTQVAIIVLATAVVRVGVAPRMVTADEPDARSRRRWDTLLLGTALVPILVVALLNLAQQLPFVSAALGSTIVGLTLAVILFAATLRYIAADRRLRLAEREALEEAERLAFHDPLTNLGNRTLAIEGLTLAMARARRSDRPVTVLFCDLDGLKQVNDVFGHEAGDRLITTVAERLTHAVRDEDLVARLGGDEFLVITERLETPRERVAFAERVLASVSTPLELAGTELHPGISVGVAVAGEGEHPIEVIRNADAAMYKAKANGRGRWEVFDPAMRAELESRQRMESEMRIALMGREIEVHLQPIIRLRDRTPVAAEALARWRHPVHGLMEARSWVAVAEESAQLVAIGRFVFVSACRWLAADGRWMSYVSVNLSARELSQDDLVDFCLHHARRHGVDPARLAFEVSEAVLAAGGPAARLQVQALAKAGFRIFLDCFGSGAGTINLWHELPVAGVKLDPAVAREVESDGGRRVAAAGAGIAAGLRITGVASGIETIEQEREFRRLGWEFGQGFLFARPELLQATAS